MNGDIVLIRITSKSPSGGRMEGEVVRIVKRGVLQTVGVFQNLETYGFVLPDDKRINRDIFIPKQSFKGAVDGQKVVVRIVSYPEGRAAAEVKLLKFSDIRMIRVLIFFPLSANINCLKHFQLK